MKKNLSGKHKDHKGKKLSRTNRSKLRRSKKVEEVFKDRVHLPILQRVRMGK